MGFTGMWANPCKKRELCPVHSPLTARKLNHGSSSAHSNEPKQCVLKIVTNFVSNRTTMAKLLNLDSERTRAKIIAAPSAVELRPLIDST